MDGVIIHWCLKLIRCDSKGIYYKISKYLFFKEIIFDISVHHHQKKNPKTMYQSVHTNIKQNNCFKIHNNLFLEQQISILEWFLKDHVTRKTGVMMLTIQLNITEINNILKYVTLDYKTSFKSLRYIYSNSQKYTAWVKIIDFYFMPKTIRRLSKDHAPWRCFANFLL